MSNTSLIDVEGSLLKEFVKQVQKLIQNADGNFMNKDGRDAKSALIELFPGAVKEIEAYTKIVNATK